MPVAAPESRIVRLTVNLPVKVWKALEAMAEEDGISKTEALRRAISTEAFRREIDKEGSQLVIQTAGGNLERVRFPY